jgi:hypothetical protein
VLGLLLAILADPILAGLLGLALALLGLALALALLGLLL